MPSLAHGPSASRAGLSLLEILVALTLLVIGAAAVSSNLVSARSLSRARSERAQASDAAASLIETLKGATFTEVFRSYNDDPADDPSGAGTAPGSAFAVSGLAPRENDADGLPGEVLFPGDGNELREDDVDAGLGMPRDLDGDGSIDATDHGADYAVLPVRVRVRWKGASGDQELEFVTVLVDF